MIFDQGVIMRSFVAGVLLASLSSVAMASASSSASISNLSFTLQDFNLDDGILPTFSVQAGASYVSGSAYSPSDSLSFSRSINGGVVTSYSTTQDTLDGLSAVTVLLNGSTTKLSGFANGASGSYNANASGVGGFSGGTVVLSAGSVLTIKGTISAVASVGGIDPACYYYCGNAASSSASVSLGYSYYEDGAYTSSNTSASVGAQAYDYYWYGTGSTQTDTKSFTLRFFNPTSQTQYASLSLSSNVSGNSVSAVPEAESTALALAGLGVVGLLARRRRRA
jgi:MYXO-CTERM domain-containing protein